MFEKYNSMTDKELYNRLYELIYVHTTTANMITSSILKWEDISVIISPSGKPVEIIIDQNTYSLDADGNILKNYKHTGVDDIKNKIIELEIMDDLFLF